MKPQVFVRQLAQEEQQKLQAGLRSSHALALPRCQVLLASSRGQRPSQIANSLGCTAQTVPNLIQAFHRQGLACLAGHSTRPKSTPPFFDAAGREGLRELLHQSPRTFPYQPLDPAIGHPVSFEPGLSPHQVSIETFRQALKRLGKSWKRAQSRIM